MSNQIVMNSSHRNISDHTIDFLVKKFSENCEDKEDPPWSSFVTYKVIIEVFVVSFLCLFGFIGNTLSFIVLWKDQDRKNSTNWLLQTLAIVDSVYLFKCLFIQTFNCIHDHTNWMPVLDKIFPYLELYIWALGSITQTATVWMVLLVTTDRYVAICKPLHMQLRSIKRAKIAVVFVIIAAIAYNIIRFFERELVYKYDTCTNTTIVSSKQTELRTDSTYFLVYKTICYFIFRSIGPLVILIFLNLQLISALRLVHQKQKEMTNRNKNRSENITAMLVAVVTIFIICEIPDTVLRILYTVHVYTKIMNIKVLRYMNVTTNMLLTVNSSVNFIIYCLIGRKFRKILKAMCCGLFHPGSAIDISETDPNTAETNMNNHAMSILKNGLGSNRQLSTKDDVQL